MTMKRFAIRALVFALGFGISASAFAEDKHRRPPVESDRYVPAHRDIIDILFAGPHYYDQQLFTTAAGACSYHRVGPDANALNKINDHHCGK